MNTIRENGFRNHFKKRKNACSDKLSRGTQGLMILLCLFCFGVSSSYSQQPTKIKVAVLPFGHANQTLDEHMAKVAENMISSVLLNSGRVALAERNELEKILAEQKFSNSGLVDDAQAVKFGQLSGAKFIVVGTISSANYILNESTTTTEKQKGKQKKSHTVTNNTETQRIESGAIGLQLKILDVTTGDLLFSDSYSFSGQSKKKIKGQESFLTDLLTDGFKQRRVSSNIIKFFPIEGSILLVDEKSALINIGSEFRLEKGTIIEVTSLEERTTSTGQIIKVPREIAKLRVTKVSGRDMSECSVQSGKLSDLREGMSVIIR